MIKPTGNKILIELPVEKEAYKDRGGILIPTQTKDESLEGKVIALGSGNRDAKGKIVPFQVKVGDTVIIGKFSGVEVNVDNSKYYLVTEEEILGVIQE